MLLILNHKKKQKPQFFLSIGLKHDSILADEYIDVIEGIERMTRFCDIFIIKLNMFLIVIPPLLLAAFNYYINHLGDESFPNMPLM